MDGHVRSATMSAERRAQAQGGGRSRERDRAPFIYEIGDVYRTQAGGEVISNRALIFRAGASKPNLPRNGDVAHCNVVEDARARRKSCGLRPVTLRQCLLCRQAIKHIIRLSLPRA